MNLDRLYAIVFGYIASQALPPTFRIDLPFALRGIGLSDVVLDQGAALARPRTKHAYR
jgi:hypothetical protein